jgi:hypothetical protein
MKSHWNWPNTQPACIEHRHTTMRPWGGMSIRIYLGLLFTRAHPYPMLTKCPRIVTHTRTWIETPALSPALSPSQYRIMSTWEKKSMDWMIAETGKRRQCRLASSKRTNILIIQAYISRIHVGVKWFITYTKYNTKNRKWATSNNASISLVIGTLKQKQSRAHSARWFGNGDS